jgi:hypothetical protein
MFPLVMALAIGAGQANAGFQGVTQRLTVPFSGQQLEALLYLNYDLRCQADASFHGVTASLTLEGARKRKIRVDLFEHTREAGLMLGSVRDDDQSFTLKLDSNPGCDLKNLNLRFVTAPGNIVLQHSPYVVVRNDQYTNRWTDLPLLMGYSLSENKDGTRELVYTDFFSDEDDSSKNLVPGWVSQYTSFNSESLMATYGRRLDVEWVYRVVFTHDWKVIRRSYQAPLPLIRFSTGGIGHREVDFDGEFLEGTEHPVLFNIAGTNVFGSAPLWDSQRKLREGYHLIPSQSLAEPRPREDAIFAHPWMFEVSDLELKREGKLKATSPNYLYIRLGGFLTSGTFAAHVVLDEGRIAESGGGVGSVDRFGEDLWGKMTYTGVPLGKDTMKVLGHLGSDVHGRVSFVGNSKLPTLGGLDSPQFYRINEAADGSYSVEDITSLFVCRQSGNWPSCRF